MAKEKNIYRINRVFSLILILISTINFVCSEFFTATADMSELERVEEVLVSNLKSYVSTLESKLKLLKRYTISLDSGKVMNLFRN